MVARILKEYKVELYRINTIQKWNRFRFEVMYKKFFIEINTLNGMRIVFDFQKYLFIFILYF